MNNETDEQRANRLYEEVTSERDKILDEIPVDREQEIKEAIEYYKSEPMYDWATKQMSNQQDMTDKYGSELVNEILRHEYDCERIPSSLISDLHRINEGKKPYKHKKKKKVTTLTKAKKKEPIEYPKRDIDKVVTPKVYDNGRYAHVTSGIYNMARKKRSLRNSTTLLLYLLQEKAWEGKKDKHKTWDHWYVEKGLIVASISVDQIAADLGAPSRTITRWSNELEDDGLIGKETENHDNIYILGKVIGGKELFFYSGDIKCQKKENLKRRKRRKRHTQ